jgi:DUF4097 and DUF4098 domain-containing protein YvlB
MKARPKCWIVVAVLGAVACVATALPARADDWSKTFNLTGKPNLRVETSNANIHLDTWDQNNISVKVTTIRFKIGDNGIRIEDHQNGDSVELNVRYPHHNFVIEYGEHRVDIEIHMPREGQMNLRTGDGKIEIAGFKGEMELRSGDGSQTIDAADGKLRASTGDGHIRANGRFDELELKTGDGGVDVRATSGSSLATGWRLESGDGNVTLEVPADLAADLDLHTSDGHIDLDMPVTTEGKLRQNEIRGKINGGGPVVTIRTGDGSIHLRKG